jgi:hypothetical protein
VEKQKVKRNRRLNKNLTTNYMSSLSTQSAALTQELTVLQALATHFLSNKTLSAPVLLSLAAALASEVNSVKTLSVADKKQLICDIVDSSLNAALEVAKLGLKSPAISIADDEIVGLKYVVKNVIPHSVDLLFAASSGQLALKMAETSCWSCLSFAKANVRGPAWDTADALLHAAAAKGVPVAAAVAAVEKTVADAAVAAGVPVEVVAAVKDAVEKVVDLSGAVVDLSGAVVDLSGVKVDLSGVKVDLSGVVVPVDLSGAKAVPDWSASAP